MDNNIKDKISLLSSPSTIESFASTSSVIAKAKQTIVTTTSAAADKTKITTPTKSTKTKTTELLSTTEDISAFTSSSLTAGLIGKVSLSTSTIEITETTAASISTEPTLMSTSLKASSQDLSSSGLSTSYKIQLLSSPSTTESFVSTSLITATAKQTEVTTTSAAAEITKTTPTKSTKATTAELFPITEGIGTWSIWGPWSICAVTCGISVHSRYRTCNKTSKNDSNCIGNIKETKECTTTPCPVYGTWTTWQSWTTCDVTCGGGRQNRSRTCVKVATTDLDCMGRSTQQQTCNKWECPSKKSIY
ncbi:hypothetical protein KUTeg_015735 [Tegillarca granosa]|uniref:Uncharacterized protein n=1 Tax=Tegillarca granosa TaxID=220873 RepID=A0ABQ9EN58_TEGGR|nr:hypothetical protein KUTeg_015735 [Tegillarca granosa]